MACSNSGRPAKDGVLQNFVVNNQLLAGIVRSNAAGFHKLCGLIADSNHQILVGGFQFPNGEPGEGFQTYALPSGSTITATALTPTLGTSWYTDVDVEIEKFQIALMGTEGPFTMTAAVATGTDPTAMTNVVGLTFTIDGVNGSTPTRDVTTSSVTIPAGSYISIFLGTIASVTTLQASWSLQIKSL